MGSELKKPSINPIRSHYKPRPVGLYHVPVVGHLILGLGSYNHKVGYPKKGYGMSLQVV